MHIAQDLTAARAGTGRWGATYHHADTCGLDMEEIVMGRTVRLKSGGPLMTVKDIDSQTLELKARCVWFDDQNQPQEAAYPLGTLVLANG